MPNTCTPPAAVQRFMCTYLWTLGYIHLPHVHIPMDLGLYPPTSCAYAYGPWVISTYIMCIYLWTLGYIHLHHVHIPRWILGYIHLPHVHIPMDLGLYPPTSCAYTYGPWVISTYIMCIYLWTLGYIHLHHVHIPRWILGYIHLPHVHIPMDLGLYPPTSCVYTYGS